MAGFILPALQIAGTVAGMLKGQPASVRHAQHSLDMLQQSAIPEGQEALGRGNAYDLALLSGNPAAQAAAIAPEVNTASSQATAERNRIASEGTGRGGGVNAAFQQATTLPSSTSVDVLTALQPDAAKRLESTGLHETNIGSDAASAGAGIAAGQQKQSQDFLSGVLDRMKLPSGTGGAQTPASPVSAGNPLSDIQTSSISGTIPEPQASPLAGETNGIPNELNTLFPYGSFGVTPA